MINEFHSNPIGIKGRMSGFTVQAFEKQLNNLNATQQSIQTLSLWLIHHRKFYQTIVNTWMKELKKGFQNSFDLIRF